MNGMPLISIVVPAYNAAPYLDECIGSILGQTYTNLEVCLVDDGSTDHTRLKADIWAERDSRVRVLSKQNGGQTSARKAGVGISEGRYVGFVDADDWIEPDTVGNMAAALLENQVSMVMCSYHREFGNDISERVVLGKSGVYPGRELAGNTIDTTVFYRTRVAIGLYLAYYERGLIKQVLAEMDERIFFAEDAACMFSCLLRAERVAVLEQPFYHWRQHPLSITRRRDRNVFESGKHLYRFLFQKFQQDNVVPAMYQALDWLIIRELLLLGYSCFTHYDYLYPFPTVRKGSRIILYGAGKFGTELYRVISRNQDYQICLWVDRYWAMLRECWANEAVESPDKITDVSYDFIVIANIRADVSREIRDRLVGKGIDKMKIACISQTVINGSAVPKEYREQIGDLSR